MKKILLITLLLIVGCSKPINDETLIEKDGLKYHPETKELYSGKVFQNRMGGEKEFEGSYKDGKEDGLWTYWDKNDGKEYRGRWLKELNIDSENPEKNLDNGSYLLRGYRGLGYIHLNINNGKPDGKCIAWDENGQKKMEGSFKDVSPDGIWTYWDKNDGKEYKGKMERKDVEDGTYFTYDVPDLRYDYRIWNHYTYKDGKEEGLSTEWYENRQKSFEGTFKNGKEEGLSTEWYENRQKSFEETFKDGKLISSKCWDEGGNETECE